MTRGGTEWMDKLEVKQMIRSDDLPLGNSWIMEGASEGDKKKKMSGDGN